VVCHNAKMCANTGKIQFSRELSVVIPAFNEEGRIGKSLAPTIDYLNQHHPNSEIIVVSDGSKDHTVDVARHYQSTFTNVSIIEYSPNKGKGFAVKTGVLAARGKYILFMDADYAVPITFVDNAMVLIKQGADIAIGSRLVEGGCKTERQSRLREMASALFSTLQAKWLGFEFADTQCGFKMYRHDVAHRLFSKQKLTSVLFDGEILFLAGRYGLRVVEFPVDWQHDADTRIAYDLAKSIHVFSELIKIRWLHRWSS
jgi:dolichyl-phosphate beta-glucosyltransferase